MEETSVHALDYLRIVWYRKWWFVVPIVLSIAGGIAALQLLPKEYTSSATIAVAAAAVSPNYINASGQIDNQERLRALSQQLVSATILSRVAKDAAIQGSGEGTPEQQQERVITSLRRAISVAVPPEGVTNINEPRRLDAFLISVKDEDPGRAHQIADLLSKQFIAENSKTRAARAEETSAFIAEQLRLSQARLVKFEEQLRGVKESHMGQLPEQMQANLSTLSGLRSQLDSNATSLRVEEDRLSMVDRQIEVLVKAATGDSDAQTALKFDPESAQGRVVRLQRELEAARIRYTPKHPEVQRLESDLKNARQEAAAERKGPEDLRAALQTDPTYRQAIADREAARLRIRDLQRASSEITQQIAQYQQRVESAPRVEQQLAAMVRDYDLEKQQYAELSSKLHTAAISESIERKGGGEQFTLLYPATLPTVPTTPVPQRVMLVAIAAGIVLGGGAVLAREYFDRSVRDARDLKTAFELPVLGEVARIQL